jgi:alpha-ketoglutarate-dependent taurine dioxygenase
VTHTRDTSFQQKLLSTFGSHSSMTPVLSADRMGRRIRGVDLSQPLSREQATLLIALFDEYQVISFPGQDQNGFHVTNLERLANHFGAPIPHPKNFANYVEYHRQGVALKPLPAHQQSSSRCNAAFPDHITCAKGANSPAVYIVTNLPGSGEHCEEKFVGGLHWHTDIEFEPIPLSTSMFYVQAAPKTRSSPLNTWVPNIKRETGFYHPDSSPELMERRERLPLNGETAYADTAAAFSDLPSSEQLALEKIILRRRVRVNDEGWLIPLVYTNPRTQKKSLHSPIWASRGDNIAPVQVEGMTLAASRHFLDKLEMHILDPKYRYDHLHQPGDVTIWSNFSTVHNAPPAKSIINSPNDARLMYRISCKGSPSFDLPRGDSKAWIDEHISPPYQSTL